MNAFQNKSNEIFTLFLLGRGRGSTPPPLFFYITKNLLFCGFWNFPQAQCLNDYFFLLQTKSLFWPTFICQIFSKLFALNPSEEICTFLVFLDEKSGFMKILKKFFHIWNGMAKGFSKMYNFSFFGQVCFYKHLYYKTGFSDKKFNFCKFANFFCRF